MAWLRALPGAWGARWGGAQLGAGQGGLSTTPGCGERARALPQPGLSGETTDTMHPVHRSPPARFLSEQADVLPAPWGTPVPGSDLLRWLPEPGSL